MEEEVAQSVWMAFRPQRTCPRTFRDARRELPIPIGVSGYALVSELRGDTVVILALKYQREAGYLD